jgi:hypothetical protein
MLNEVAFDVRERGLEQTAIALDVVFVRAPTSQSLFNHIAIHPGRVVNGPDAPGHQSSAGQPCTIHGRFIRVATIVPGKAAMGGVIRRYPVWPWGLVKHDTIALPFATIVHDFDRLSPAQSPKSGV